MFFVIEKALKKIKALHIHHIMLQCDDVTICYPNNDVVDDVLAKTWVECLARGEGDEAGWDDSLYLGEHLFQAQL